MSKTEIYMTVAPVLLLFSDIAYHAVHRTEAAPAPTACISFNEQGVNLESTDPKAPVTPASGFNITGFCLR